MAINRTTAAVYLPPAEIEYRGCRYGLIEHAINLRRGAKSSKIWDVGDEYQALGDPNKRVWRCQLCIKDNMIGLPSGRTGAVTRHIAARHQLAVRQAFYP
jgi:hypothetical protein